ncbi:MAG: helix-turn-helix transcriptional regulator [Lachnospiraceae bacterium]|nr:helix-turn-helix transcriptional regulator [Lachnospiraceae bacterium]
MEIILDKIMYSRNLSVRQVSSLTDIPKSTINKIQLQQKSPTMDEMEAIAKGLKLRITDLFLSDYK